MEIDIADSRFFVTKEAVLLFSCSVDFGYSGDSYNDAQLVWD